MKVAVVINEDLSRFTTRHAESYGFFRILLFFIYLFKGGKQCFFLFFFGEAFEKKLKNHLSLS